MPSLNLIPRPSFCRFGQGVLSLKKTFLWTGLDDRPLIRQWLVDETMRAGNSPREGSTTIDFKIEPCETAGSPEAHKIAIDRHGIMVRAATEAGLLAAAQTLRQLLAQAVLDGTWELPCVEIVDEPRFQWRGMHLDCARHFMPFPFILKFIDLLALLRFNVFHWHLTDDQGWRLEIPEYPLLTAFGSVRRRTLIGHQVHEPQPRRYTVEPHAGFYTQEQVREAVAYAAARGITVLPEIEMPGHASAAIAAYPKLGCRGESIEVPQEWGVWRNLFCAGSPHALGVLDHVLDAVLRLFPSAFIHLGGDECPTDYWRECPECQRTMRAEHLANERELHGWFIRRFARRLKDQKRRAIGWDEILNAGELPRDTVVMSWRGHHKTMEAARRGLEVISAITSHTYFDRYQTADNASEPLCFGGQLPLEKVYEFDPIPEQLEPEYHRNVIGGQGQIWTEYMPTPEVVEQMALPRMLALAESLWSPSAGRDWNDFRTRMRGSLQRLGRLGYRFTELPEDDSSSVA